MKYKIIGFTAIFLLTFLFYLQGYHYINTAWNSIRQNLAAVFLHESITITDLKSRYDGAGQGKTKVRVLIVPGHEPAYGGAEYKDLNEGDMNVELAGYLEKFLKNDSHYDVMLSRGVNGWDRALSAFFNESSEKISRFINENHDNMLHLVNNGSVVKVMDGIKHSKAPKDVALRLYGINMWADENKIDVLIHVHFNDYPRKNAGMLGKYSGFAIYVPERQYSNATTTRALADAVYKRLAKYNPTSDLPKEKAGVIEEQDLIAIGSNNTLEAPSMLIEYGYIYESQFADSKVRKLVLKDLAFQTYLGMGDFFGDRGTAYAYDTLLLPYVWDSTFTRIKSDKNDVLALQTALMAEGLYPVSPKNKNDCPRTGTFGECTSSALEEFQRKYGIKSEKNMVGKETAKVLNRLYSL